MSRISSAKGDGTQPEIMVTTCGLLQAVGAYIVLDEIEIRKKSGVPEIHQSFYKLL